MPKAYFVEDPDFEDNLLHWRGSLNPVGDRVRAAADRIRAEVVRVSRADSAEATQAVNATLARRFTKSGRRAHLQARALAYSLRRYSELVYAAEIAQPSENIAIVAAGHAAGAQIEFGGTDDVIKAGTEPLVYTARHILRRAI